MKTTIASTMRMGAEGIKVMTSGRLGGAEMARTNNIKKEEFLCTLSVLILTML
jgi:small subunit ribosomal protein S3